MQKTFHLKSIQQVSNAEAAWRASIGSEHINNPAKAVKRLNDCELVVTTVRGDELTFIFYPVEKKR